MSTQYCPSCGEPNAQFVDAAHCTACLKCEDCDSFDIGTFNCFEGTIYYCEDCKKRLEFHYNDGSVKIY